MSLNSSANGEHSTMKTGGILEGVMSGRIWLEVAWRLLSLLLSNHLANVLTVIVCNLDETNTYSSRLIGTFWIVDV